MGEDIGPVPWAGQQAVLALPVHMDAANAGEIREELSVINGGAMALIADMTATTWCDHAGADAVVRVFQRAFISGTELRLVVTTEHVSRVLSLTSLGHLVPIYLSLEAGHGRQRAGGGARRGGRAGAWWQQIMGGKHRRVWAIAAFVRGPDARARRAGRWPIWLCRSCAVR